MKKISLKQTFAKRRNSVKNSFTQKAVITALCLACAFSVSACGKRSSTNQNKDPLTGVDQSQSSESGSSEGGSEAGSEDASGAANGDFSEFDAMIGDENTDPNSIIDYINTNIAGAAMSDVRNFFTGLLSFGSDVRNIDFTRLEDSRQYMPEDMIAFMDLMRLEGQTPSMVMSDEENRKVINMTLSEMLERALLFEQHLAKYPNETSSDAAARLYEEIATNAISGGYNKTEGIDHYYKGETKDVIDRESLQYYQQFAEANKDSNLGKIVSEYINVLQTNDFKINDAMEDFYNGLRERLDVDNLKDLNVNTENSQNNAADNNNGDGTGSNAENGTDNKDVNGTNKNTADSNGTNSNAADTVIEGTVNK